MNLSSEANAPADIEAIGNPEAVTTGTDENAEQLKRRHSELEQVGWLCFC